jgi:deoxyadenosine/deoxycytidine kinase
MGRLIAVLGNTGVGKTTLVHALADRYPINVGLEEHDQRPFQHEFFKHHQLAFSNQVDYLLSRAEQESRLRRCKGIGMMDGGLEMDFHVFTRLFYIRKYLSLEEYHLCQRLYEFFRTQLPAPDLIIHLFASPGIIQKRLGFRTRMNIAERNDIALIDQLLYEYVSTLTPDKLFTLDVSENDPGYKCLLPLIDKALQPFLS